ncbi:hypothetical protein BT63DRAFT_400006 [Microthyrium microscopicum]|uniref:Uncharacterized protein n=1 Tax=Microthyrium microscopicum TaxID=703497 RepID=A0A6A6UE57_9PEZI|nr:hypothetical protein BT63DRAFT_400006 [Microthyrium microscopicum]
MDLSSGSLHVGFQGRPLLDAITSLSNGSVAALCNALLMNSLLLSNNLNLSTAIWYLALLPTYQCLTFVFHSMASPSVPGQDLIQKVVEACGCSMERAVELLQV